MAMASISTSCPCNSVCSASSTLTAASSQQSVATQCVSRIALGNGLVARDGGGFAGVVLRQSSWKGTVDGHPKRTQRQAWRVDAGLKETALTEKEWGPPVTLGTAQLPQDVDLKRLQTLLYQWGNNLTQNANLPLPVPLKVDKVEGGVRLGYIRVVDGKMEDLVHIDVLVTPLSDEQPKAMFRAIRNGPMKNSVPPGEPAIMQSLLAALKISIPLARTSG